LVSDVSFDAHDLTYGAVVLLKTPFLAISVIDV
jgi:hypothetical protein